MSAADEERLARVALGCLVEPGDPRLVRLVAELGAVAVRGHLAEERDLGGVQSDVSTRLAGLDPERELAQAARLGIRFVMPGDEEWPASLDQLYSAETVHERGGPPLGLWVKGPVRLNELERSVAVVGARSATTYGTSVAGEIAAVVARAGHPVISGAAFGIDQAAHRGALGASGTTVAVLACGADRVYPAAHRALLEHLGEHAAILSEVPPGRAPTRTRFLSRNRIIAAITRGTVVVEAALRSGALNTAGWAGRLHRPVMGVPGPVTAAQSQGVHQLIRSGAASLVTGGADVLELVGSSGEHLTGRRRGHARRRDVLSPREAQVLDAVPVLRAVGADSVARSAGVGLMEVRSVLVRLEHLGLVTPVGSGWRLSGTNDAVLPSAAPEVPTMAP